MTETSSKGVLRLTIAMFLSVGLLGMWIGGCGNQTPEQKIERLIEELRDEDWIVRADASAVQNTRARFAAVQRQKR